MKIFSKKNASIQCHKLWQSIIKNSTSLRGGNPTWQSIIIFIIFILAFLLRIYGLNWDNNNHLHPDERFLTMVVNDIKLPTSVSQYFDTNTSPLNPYNYSQYQFFVYGTFPLFITKLLAVILHLDNYNHITLLGRLLSAFFDASNIVLLYFIAKKILKKYYVILPPLLYAFLAFSLQLSHFFAVDTFLTFFLLLTFTLFVYDLLLPAFFMFGIALSCKISALYFTPIILLFVLKKYLSKKKAVSFLIKTICYSLFTVLSFRVFQPYSFKNLFTINPIFVENLRTLSSFSDPDIYYPPAVQWINRPLVLDSLVNHFVWGIGLAITIPLLYLIFLYLKKPKIKFNLNLIIVCWILLLFVYQSLQFAHTMRYYLPIYPFVCLIFVVLLSHFKVNRRIIFIIFSLNILYATAFLSIYLRPNSRVQATNWILHNISFNKTISSEYWDDALPLGYSPYKSISLPLFDPDSSPKWLSLNRSLDQLDYLIMSSNRLWASIPRVPKKYPQASKFYDDLFSENTDFKIVKKFVSYPGYSLPFLKSCYYFGPSNYPGLKSVWFEKDIDCPYPGIYLRDDTAEEAFTVYDHPQILIFKK
jgi:hypothetical protein